MSIAFETVILLLLSVTIGMMVFYLMLGNRREEESRREYSTLKNLVNALVNGQRDFQEHTKRLETMVSCTAQDAENMKLQLQLALDLKKDLDKKGTPSHSQDWRKEWERALAKLSPGKRREIDEDDRAYTELHKHKRTITEAMLQEVETLAARGA